jgi:hypothetical protein
MEGMPSVAHELAVLTLADDPSLLVRLLATLAGVVLEGPLERVDATLRPAQSAEVRPDLHFRGATGRSLVFELQNDVEPSKLRRLHLAVAILHDATGQLPDVVVLTRSRRVARWARRMEPLKGSLGTRLVLTPIVLYIGDAEAERLLATGHPGLAFFAAWSMQKRAGPHAVAVVKRAIEVVDRQPPELRQPMRRAIYGVSSKRVIALLEGTMIDWNRIQISPRARRLADMHEALVVKAEARGRADGEARGRADGEARGAVHAKAEALLTVLAARGLGVTDPVRARVLACSDVPTLDRWIARAATAVAVDVVLAG